jgi:hypothetical protein
MSATMFVMNEAVSSCCGKPVANGACSCQSRRTEQPGQRTSYVGRNQAAPAPLGLPTYGPEAPVANSNPTVNNGGGLPQTDWDAIFNADAAKRNEQSKQQTTNADSGGHIPLGHPVWNW